MKPHGVRFKHKVKHLPTCLPVEIYGNELEIITQYVGVQVGWPADDKKIRKTPHTVLRSGPVLSWNEQNEFHSHEEILWW